MKMKCRDRCKVCRSSTQYGIKAAANVAADAYSCCSLYAAKNQVNSHTILRIIESRVQELISTPLPTTKFEILARTHALLLYHIIRLFDGNIQARGAAESTRHALETVAVALLNHIDFDHLAPANAAGGDPLPLYPLASTRQFWKEWIYQESAKRTFIVTFFMLQTYRYLSGDIPSQCDIRLYRCYSWTLSAYLWHAADAVDFAVAWKQKNHFEITNVKYVSPQAFPQYSRVYIIAGRARG